MNASAQRRKRLVRLRAIEHRIAATRLARADTAVQAVVDIAERVTRMRNGLACVPGATSGRLLQGACELAQRLDHAGASLTAPRADAERVMAIRHGERVAAHLAEERAMRIDAQLSQREQIARDLREDAARPHRPRASWPAR